MSLSKFPEKPLPSYTRSPFEVALIIQHELYYDINEQVEIVNFNTLLLNTDQLRIFEYVISVVNDTEVYRIVFFVDSPGGTGKTFPYNTLVSKVHSQSRIDHGMANSDIAALLLQGRRKVHSRLKVPIETE